MFSSFCFLLSNKIFDLVIEMRNYCILWLNSLRYQLAPYFDERRHHIEGILLFASLFFRGRDKYLPLDLRLFRQLLLLNSLKRVSLDHTELQLLLFGFPFGHFFIFRLFNVLR